MKVTFLGHSCFLLQDDDISIIIDPFLTGNPSASIAPTSIKVDYVLVTHGHADHVGDAVQIAKNNDCPIVASYELCKLLSLQSVKIEPMHIGGKIRFDWGWVKMVHALHGSAAELGGENFEHAGLASGFIVHIGKKTFYHAGDTGLFSDMKLISELDTIDVAALPIGDRFTMGPDDAKVAASWLKSKTTIPMHYNTFPPIIQDAHKWVRSLCSENINAVVLDPNQSLSIV